jgi:EAL domain-containing protein (putative c-di-GMP-specific phosphodiesterase class I)/DNA-binding NarL/FixJ family response regulator
VTSPVRLLIAEDDTLVREALLDLLSTEASVEIVAVAVDAAEAIALGAARLPTVALVDVRMPAGGGPRAARELTRLPHPPRVIAYSAFDEREGVIEMLQSGAIAYVVKGGPIDEVIHAIHRAARGQFTLSPVAADHAMHVLVDRLEHEGDLATARREVTSRIRAALRPGTIQPVFQGIFELQGRTLVGHEALARFTSPPQLGPERWFADAFAINLGVELELAALRAQVAAVRKADPSCARRTYVSLNASPATMHSDAFAMALEPIAPDQIVVEATEHALIPDYRAFAAALARLRTAGVRLAVDDVGAGYASLRHIVHLAPDVIKIDLSLTRNVDVDPARRAIVAALTSFAAQTSAKVVAEGLETESELAMMLELGVGFGQGYLLGRPGPLELHNDLDPSP